ncbi:MULTISPECIES: DUF1206 domain-containing protein [Mycolicibacterium]|uniref:DUF1206 domain-containing protein n=2 Tax=Mycolicibacterium gilvum TaxID=1804 RepID=E6TGK0_MYCSR|nr:MULTISPECIES: DUF1206 domain-containing protein [Mycolicibacterium]ABP47657.1 protein of unknown function DUF1206 [Mycolicibacterium gilvum PYR-GCK]ADU01170.1 protein of unknown function (DUF1206) [Mycolicibacterium gilvum Spyr1]MBV5246074.1 DUF1206 domain-containing protein [Mycolicibacterium sp. PAM1]
MSFKGAVNRATGSRTVEWIARAGYPVNGLLHLLIAYIIARIAFGFAGEADQTGALATLAEQRGGATSLWVVALGLVALAMWRLAETVVGLHPGEHSYAHLRDAPLINRLKAFGLALVYLALAFTAAQFALGVGRKGTERAEGLSARLMQTGEGKAVLVAIGLAIGAFGSYFVYKGAWRKFYGDLTVPGGRLLTVLGVCGHVAEGVVLIAAGLSVIGASFLRDPSRATGLDAAVEAVGRAQFGQVLLLVAAAGFAAYGLYQFALTRYSRM